MFKLANPNLRVNGHDYEDFVEGQSLSCALPKATTDTLQRPNPSMNYWTEEYGHSTQKESNGTSSLQSGGNKCLQSFGDPNRD